VSHARRAVILARGLGTRMRAHDATVTLTTEQQRAADAGHKAMMPIHGRPFLDYAISAVRDAGIDRVALVVAPDADAVRRYYEDVAPPSRVRLEFVVQPEARGTADAVLCAQTWTDGQPFLVMNSDNLYPVSALRDLVALDEPGLPGFDADDLVHTSNIPRERIASFALLEVDARGYLTSIVEKPDQHLLHDQHLQRFQRGRDPQHTAISMNVWRFDPLIFEACRDVPQSARGEVELPEAVGLAVSRGVPFRVVPASGPVLDLSRRADAADVERRLDGVEPRP
jgi:glucose-1-phosphate thymidylyltransferase